MGPYSHQIVQTMFVESFHIHLHSMYPTHSYTSVSSVSFLQTLLVRDTAQLLLYDLLAQPPQVLAQFVILCLFRGVGGFAVGEDLD